MATISSPRQTNQLPLSAPQHPEIAPIWRLFSALSISLLATTGDTYGDALPLFDAHIHYNHDAWEVVSPKEAIERLRKAGVVRALVSSSSDDGTQRLYAQAPDLIVPELRPYRKNGETTSWLRDESIIEHVEQRLKQHKYVALGEFHVSGANADLPVVRRIVQLAKQYGLMLHVHSDPDAVERLFRQNPEARIIWAHAGYEKPPAVKEMLRRYTNLWAELSSREDVAPDGRLAQEWREVLLEFPNRFMVGTDTHILERWNLIDVSAAQTRRWLSELPIEVAESIAFKNGEELLTAAFVQHR